MVILKHLNTSLCMCARLLIFIFVLVLFLVCKCIVSHLSQYSEFCAKLPSHAQKHWSIHIHYDLHTLIYRSQMCHSGNSVKLSFYHSIECDVFSNRTFQTYIDTHIHTTTLTAVLIFFSRKCVFFCIECRAHKSYTYTRRSMVENLKKNSFDFFFVLKF